MGSQRNENLLLEALPQPARQSLKLRMEEVVVPAGTVVYEADQVPRYAWFILSGAASTMVSMADGRSAEIGMWGNEGVIPCFHLLGGTPGAPYRCLMQIETHALRIPFPEIQREMTRLEPFRLLVQRCAQRRSMILAINAACNRLHGAEQRLARWLLTVHDLTGTDRLMVSQDFLANILGARRTTVTLAAGALRGRKLISSRRGLIEILNSQRLAEASCECYESVRGLLRNFYG
jgi:CRP-like cAMP-binding protein